ncbi:hypothetical protein ACFVS2_21615 [Brevibacillus sp. NPDC058079]|uniref:hypothetical protein n=1 Tax=Brevibacillus sp. NPDC058079 TaxID=3346330 RepID=UPI0036E67720
MDLVSQYKTGLEQLKKTKEFLQELNPVDYELRSIIFTIDQKINKTEQMLSNFQNKAHSHRCGLCDRSYEEEETRGVGSIKICPHCRVIYTKFKVSSEWESKYGLPQGTIKRDCHAKDGNPAKLQSFMDCGLVYKSGSSYIVCEVVMKEYYENEDLYKRRKSRSKVTE